MYCNGLRPREADEQRGEGTERDLDASIDWHGQSESKVIPVRIYQM